MSWCLELIGSFNDPQLATGPAFICETFIEHLVRARAYASPGGSRMSQFRPWAGGTVRRKMVEGGGQREGGWSRTRETWQQGAGEKGINSEMLK
jgi:hypothetical protein